MPPLDTPPLRVLIRDPRVSLDSEEIIDWGLQALGVPGLWSITRGEGINVGVIDTGVDFDHTDLKDAIADAKSFGASAGQDAYDHHGHGTHVCGIIAARENNQGIIGIAPNSQLYIAKVLNNKEPLSADAVAEAINWCVEKRVDIINISLWLINGSTTLENAVRGARDAGIAIVAAAGNQGSYRDFICYPAKYDDVISVGSVDSNQELSVTSSVGNRLDVLAPGEDIYSTIPNNMYAKCSGTSQACPFVTGVAALVLARHKFIQPPSPTPCRTPEELREHLITTATDIHPVGVGGYPGFRIVNPAAADG